MANTRLPIAVAFAAVASLILLAVVPAPRLEANIRLDDHETSWPDHQDVQAAAVDRLAQRVPVAEARDDRSTVLVSGPAAGDLTAAVNELVAADVESRRPDVDQLRDDVTRRLDLLGAAESGDDATTLALAVVDAEDALAEGAVLEAASRSRFVALGEPTEAGANPALPAWLTAAVLLLGSIAAFVLGRTTR